ncbi:hypothetical protein C8Q79DRAFT_362548 [Trametes meyenii]|nr:hypothetical protein C8Q79DRAFT_362548 [Trametes meyenii]
MAHRCVRKLRLAAPSSFAHVRHFSATTSRLDALSAPAAEFSTTASTSSTPARERPIDTLRNRRADELRALLSLSSPSPHRVWANYIELLQFSGSAGVPRDIHQGVLRKCAPPATFLRAISAKLMEEGGRFKDHALYETRFRDVIRNIRAMGETPTLEDYHCVLEKFAALGSYPSAMMVLEEMAQVGLPKDTETYGLCLQALSYRLTLPVWHLHRPSLVDEVTKHCLKILDEMSLTNLPYTSRNVDLAFRILKETMNMEGFTALMKGAYGIDLAYPDRSPLEFWDKKGAPSTGLNVQDGITPRLPTPLPFSLAAFNTALDYLGRSGNVSKMVQTFEVLTNPLPTAASDPSFNDDDDDDFGYANPSVAPYRAPHIQPNTTTFRILLRWIHKAEHAVLARHYLLVALETEATQGRRLREQIRTKHPQEITAPRMVVTRDILLSVFSLANDNKNVELLRWTLYKVRKVVRRKRYDLAYYQQVRARWIEEGLYQPVTLSDAQLEGTEEELPLGPSTSRFHSFFSPSASLRSANDLSFSPDGGPASSPPPSSETPKPFDIDLHVNLIRRDLDKVVDLESQVEDVYARTIQRIKERLGRRVWGRKDIYLRDVERRMPVSKEFWKAHVNYRARSEVQAQQVASSGPRSKLRPRVESILPPTHTAFPVDEHPQPSPVELSSTPSPSKSSHEP